MKCAADARLECQNTDELAVLVKKPPAARAGVKRRGHLNHLGAIVIVQGDYASFTDREMVAAKITAGIDLLTDRQTFGWVGVCASDAGHLEDTNVANRILRFDLGAPDAAIVDDAKVMRRGSDVTVGNQPICSQQHGRSLGHFAVRVIRLHFDNGSAGKVFTGKAMQWVRKRPY